MQLVLNFGLQRQNHIDLNQRLMFVESCCLMPNEQYFSSFMAFDKMIMMSALYQKNTLTRSTQTHYSDQVPTSLCSLSLVLCAQRRSNKYQCYSLWCSYSLMLHTQQRSNKYQCYSLWIDLTWGQTHDLPHLEASTLTVIPQICFSCLYKPQSSYHNDT